MTDSSALIDLGRMPGAPLAVFRVSRRDDSSVTALLTLAALVLTASRPVVRGAGAAGRCAVVGRGFLR